MGYSIESLQADCYENTSCLINKFDIHDDTVLAEIEGKITFAKMSELERMPLKGKFDFEHYKAIHKYIFEDIYEWAGTVRAVNMTKKGTSFVNASEINDIAEKIFLRLRKKNFLTGLTIEELTEEITDFYCSTNLLHPFREGNGRTQRTFITQLIRNAGYDIDFYDIDKDDLMIATIQAANGVTDPLKKLFSENITK